MTAPERCPCCGGMVGGNTYEMSLLAPPVLLTLPVCAACEAILTGNDEAAHDALVLAFVNEAGGCRAQTIH